MPSGSCQVAPVGHAVDAGRILALLAGDRAGRTCPRRAPARGRSRGCRPRDRCPRIALLALELEHADPVDLGIARLVVLVDAGVDAAAAADAARDVEPVAEDHARRSDRSPPTLTGLPYSCEYSALQPARAARRAPRARARRKCFWKKALEVEGLRRARDAGERRRRRRPRSSGTRGAKRLACSRSRLLIRRRPPKAAAGGQADLAGPHRRRLGLERLEERRMRVVAGDAGEVLLRPPPVPRCACRARRRASRASFLAWQRVHRRHDSAISTGDASDR